MIRLHILFTLLMLTASSCQKSCLDPSAETLLETELEVIENRLMQSNIVGGQAMLSIFFFEQITGIPSSVQYGDTSVYNNKSDFQSDKKSWMSWLREHGCSFTTSQLRQKKQDIQKRHPYLS